MKNFYWLRPFNSRWKTTRILAVVSEPLATLTLLATDEPKSDKATKTETPAAQKSEAASPNVQPKAPPKMLTGAELYSMHCNRCHPERYPTERTAAQWKTILLHMRVRANLPAEQARTILKYLQDNSGR